MIRLELLNLERAPTKEINWSSPRRIEGIGKIAGDTHNNMFWDPCKEKYLGFTRTRGKLGREVARIESGDFLEWKSNGVVMEGLEEGLQPYAMPVFRHGGVYLGLAAIFALHPVDRVWTAVAPTRRNEIYLQLKPGETRILRTFDKGRRSRYG